MKFDVRTLEILKNLSTINPSIKFTAGNVLRTIAPVSKTILVRANISTTIDSDFCIGELNRFMAACSIFNDPEIILKDTHALIKGDTNQLVYRYTPEITIDLPPEDDLELPSVDVQFTLTNEMFQTIRKALAILSNTEMVVSGKDGQLKIIATRAVKDGKEHADHYDINIGQTDKTFDAVFKAEHLKLLPLDYEVSISSAGFAHFRNPEIEYWIVIDGNTSKFE